MSTLSSIQKEITSSLAIKLGLSTRESLIEAKLITGRTHQIRVHALHTGHPIVGDERYGMPETNAMAKKLGLKRLFLHAQSIAFPDDSGNELHFTAPLPDDLDRFLNRIRGGGRKRRI